MGCTTLSRVLDDLWEKWDDELIKLGCAALAAATTNPETAITCLEQGGKLNQALDDMVKFWNQMAANSWARIGPRRLDLDTDLVGRIVGPGDRTFISAAPMDEDQVTISIKERGGRGKTEVSICVHTPDGKVKSLGEMLFNEDRRAKMKTENESKTVRGVKGKFLSVVFDGKSATNKFAYTLHVDTH